MILQLTTMWKSLKIYVIPTIANMNHLLGKLMKDIIDHLSETLSIIFQALEFFKNPWPLQYFSSCTGNKIWFKSYIVYDIDLGSWFAFNFDFWK